MRQLPKKRRLECYLAIRMPIHTDVCGPIKTGTPAILRKKMESNSNELYCTVQNKMELQKERTAPFMKVLEA